jgi:hypothetical protein
MDMTEIEARFGVQDKVWILADGAAARGASAAHSGIPPPACYAT